MTGSATAVAGLWMIAPLTNIVTKAWTGSFIDYRSKRTIMMVTYCSRAIFICTIPFVPNMYVIYIVLVLLSIANAFFSPASTTYITMVVPVEKRKQFNAIRSFVTSGAFIIGPAIGGMLIVMTSMLVTLIVNALFFVVAALLLFRVPNKEKVDQATIPKLTFSQVLYDMKIVKGFMLLNRYSTFIYASFLLIMLFSFAMDVQEVVFTQHVIGLSELEYSLLISITGIGSIVGAIILSFVSSKLSVRWMIVTGLFFMTSGYVIYAFSWSFTSIVVGFVILGFFNVFVNAGMMTFYQQNVPVEVMGRVTSMYQLAQSIFQIIFILTTGVIADVFSLRMTIVVLALTMLILTMIFIGSVMQRTRQNYFDPN